MLTGKKLTALFCYVGVEDGDAYEKQTLAHAKFVNQVNEGGAYFTAKELEAVVWALDRVADDPDCHWFPSSTVTLIDKLSRKFHPKRKA